MLLPMYVDRLQSGSVSTVARAEVVVDHGAVAVLDAHHAAGQLSGDQAMAMAVDKAVVYGVGMVTVRNAFHFGAAARYVIHAATRGCIGLAMANTRPLMPAPGGATPVVGNNPLAIAVPRGNPGPIVLDMALSAAALGKIRLAAQQGESIPVSWATDADGSPTTDPQAAIDGMLLPVGGAKGFGLALMVDVLTGVLSSGGFGQHVAGLYADVTVPNNCAHTFIAVNVAVFGPVDGFLRRLDELATQVTGSPTTRSDARIVLPGQPEADRASRAQAEGVTVDDAVLTALHDLAERLGLDIPELDPIPKEPTP
jgi:LDH2 family malate/lactate/ureidoglycolate dehydrogenase